MSRSTALAVGVWICTLSLCAWAQEPESRPAAPAKKVVKISVRESIDGKISKRGICIYFLAKKLEEAGVDVLGGPEKKKEKEEKKKAPEGEPEKGEGSEGGSGAPTSPESPATRPPDLEIHVEIEAKRDFKNESVFYGQVVAYRYEVGAKAKIVDPSGKVLATVEESESLMKSKLNEARDFAIKRCTFWLIAGLFKQESLRAVFKPEFLPEVDRWVEETLSKRKGADKQD